VKPLSVREVRMLIDLDRAMDRGEQPYVTHEGWRWAFPGELLEALGLKTGETVSRSVLYQIQVLNLRHLEEQIAAQRTAELIAEVAP
jgi:hypothetical protein